MGKKQRNISIITNVLKRMLVILICATLFWMIFILSDLFAMKKDIQSMEKKLHQLEKMEHSEQGIDDAEYMEKYISLSEHADAEMERLVSIVGIVATVYTVFGALIVFKVPKEIDKKIEDLDEYVSQANEAAEESKYQLEIMDALYNEKNGEQTHFEQICNITKVIKKYPDKSEAYTQRGILYGKIKKYDEAISDYRIAIKLATEDVTDYYNGLGVMYCRKGELAEALKYHNRTIKSAPNNEKYYTNRGLCYVKQNKYDFAMQDFNKALEINNIYKRALLNRSHLYWKMMNEESDIDKKEEYYQCSIADIEEVIYLVFDDAILKTFGGNVNPETFAYAKEYFFWIALGIPFYMFGQAMNPIIRSDGSPKFAMFATAAGAVTNIILDPIFIFPMRMGMEGAAIATVIGQLVTAILSVWYLCHMKTIKLGKSSLGIWGGLMKKFLALGFTSLLAQISLVISMAAVQNMCTKYGALHEIFGQTEYAQIPLAVLGIVMKFFQIAISVAIGMAAGCIPIVGYNIGAGRKDRAKKLFTYLLVGEFIVGFIALLAAEFLPLQIIGIFGAANESAYYTEFAVRCFRIYLCMLPIATLNKGAFIYLQAMGKAAASTMITMAREIVFGVALPILMPIVWGLDGILYSFPVADVLTFIIAVIVITKTYRELTVKDVKKTREA